MEKKCIVCNETFKLKPYREKTAFYCSRKCKGVDDGKRMEGNTFAKNKPAWNKGIKGLRLSSKTEFKKGNIPWNYKLKGIHLSKKSEFKKGIIPPNKLVVGSLVIRTDYKHQNKKRNWIKVAEPNTWKQNAIYVWSEKFGEVPKGMVIHHKDRNTLNDDISNLECLTRKEHINEHRKEFKK